MKRAAAAADGETLLMTMRGTHAQAEEVRRLTQLAESADELHRLCCHTYERLLALATATSNRRTPPRGRTVDRVPKAGPLTEGQARWARRGATTS